MNELKNLTQTIKDKSTNNDLQNITLKTKRRPTPTPVQPVVNTVVPDTEKEIRYNGSQMTTPRYHRKLIVPASCLGVKPLIHQSELRTYTKVVPFQEKSSFHFVVL
jgi:carbonic anhydrase